RLISMVDQLDQLKEWDYVSKQTFLEKESLDMPLLINQSVELFHWSLKKSGLEIDVDTEPGTVNVYSGGIQQVMGNLIDNAIRYHSCKGSIRIKCDNKSTYYKFSIYEYCKYIHANNIYKMFERFYRINQARTRDSDGTGLGLAISKEIIEHHRGQIGVTSDDHYHTFWFSIPL